MVEPGSGEAVGGDTPRGVDTADAAPERDIPTFSVLVGSLIILTTGVVFSFGGLAFRITDDVNAWQYAILRGIGALGVTAIILGVRYRGRFSELIGPIDRSHLGAGLLMALMNAAFLISLERASVAFILALQTLAPLAAAYFSWILLRERVSRAVIAATMVSLVGVLIMFSATLTDRVDPLGLIAVGIPVAFGLYATLIRAAKTIDPQVPIVVAGAVLTVIGVIGALSTGGLGISLHDALIGLFAGSALLAIPVAFLNHATRVVPASEVALLLMSEVILAPVWVWLFVDETPETTTLLGGSIVFAAVAGLLIWRRQRSIVTFARR
ncbi:MAG: DMT family transporter [Actinomycetota bacterium]